MRDLANLRLALSVCALTVKRFAESPLKRGVSDSEPRQHFTISAFKPSFLKLKIGSRTTIFSYLRITNTPPLCVHSQRSRLKPACAGFFLSSRRLARVKFYLPEPLARWAATVEKAASGHLPRAGRRSEVKKTRRFKLDLTGSHLGFHLVV